MSQIDDLSIEDWDRVSHGQHTGNTIGCPYCVFVFGSNLQGIHGRGAAKDARVFYGAKIGIGAGRYGGSYAIPTKRTPYESLPLSEIRLYVSDFLAYAASQPEMTFFVTRVGCGLAGYKDEDIAPMFAGAPENCTLPDEWKALTKPNP
jgi:hypothetical protein